MLSCGSPVRWNASMVQAVEPSRRGMAALRKRQAIRFSLNPSAKKCLS